MRQDGIDETLGGHLPTIESILTHMLNNKLLKNIFIKGVI